MKTSESAFSQFCHIAYITQSSVKMHCMSSSCHEQKRERGLCVSTSHSHTRLHSYKKRVQKGSSAVPIGEAFLVPGRMLCGKGSTWNPKRFYLKPKRVLQFKAQKAGQEDRQAIPQGSLNPAGGCLHILKITLPPSDWDQFSFMSCQCLRTESRLVCLDRVSRSTYLALLISYVLYILYFLLHLAYAALSLLIRILICVYIPFLTYICVLGRCGIVRLHVRYCCTVGTRSTSISLHLHSHLLTMCMWQIKFDLKKC